MTRSGSRSPERDGPEVPGEHLSLTIRTRAILAERFVPIVMVLLVLTVGAGWLTVTTHVAPGSHVEERVELIYERDASFAHRATVTNPNPVYGTGTVLQDRDVYFTGISPVLNGTFVYRYEAPGTGRLTVTPKLTLILHAVDTREDPPREYWRLSKALGTVSGEDVSSPGRVQREFQVNVSALGREVARIEADLGVVPGQIEAVVVARVREAGRVDGRPVNAVLTRRLRLELRPATYAVTQPEVSRAPVRTTRRVTVLNEYGPVRRWGSVAVLACSVLALAGLVGANRSGRLEPSPVDLRRLEFANLREDYDGWFTTGRLPPEVLDTPTVEVDSLQELLHIAVHTDRRVIEAPEGRKFEVLGPEFRYVYQRPVASPGGA